MTHSLVLACLASVAAFLGFALPAASQSALTTVEAGHWTTLARITTLTQELTPQGLAPITVSVGKLVAGNFLATQWHDVNNNPGQGKTILQVTPQGVATPFATIDTANATVLANCGRFGVGLTMALAVLSKGFVVVGSTPIPVGGTVAGTGCLLVLDSNGNLLDAHAAQEKTSSPGVMTGGGPWAMAVSEFNGGSNAYLYVSYVLGTCPACTFTLSGAQGGKVVRYQLQVPGGPFSSSFWGGAPDVIASGFPTQPGNICGGHVGPTGLLLTQGNGAYPGQLEDRLFIANKLNNSVGVLQGPGACSTLAGATPQCSTQTVAWGGFLNGPVGLTQSSFGTIVGANRAVGTVFEIAPTVDANVQLAAAKATACDPMAPGWPPGANSLFNVMYHPLSPSTLVFTDECFNTLNTLTIARPPSLGRKFL